MTASAWTAAAWTSGQPSWNAGIRSMLHFGGTLTLNGVISYMTYSFDKFVLGRVWGAVRRSAITAWHRNSSSRQRKLSTRRSAA